MRGTFISVKEIEVENIVWLLVKISGVSAENLMYTAYKKFVAKYGLIENVTAYKDEKTGNLYPVVTLQILCMFLFGRN